MEFSENNHIPYVSKVDGGTIDLVRSHGAKVVSSAEILHRFTSILSLEQLRTHLKAAAILDTAVNEAWRLIANALKRGDEITELDVQRYLLKIFDKEGCIASDPPICAVNANSANPHHQTSSTPIRKGDFILIDLWCKKKEKGSIYADITRVAVASEKPSARQKEVFDVVKRARDQAMELINERLQNSQPLMGCEIDQACREVIVKAGYGQYFTHRTGHNIFENDHGDGANIDNYESRDTRQILPSTCFSIEPGIYLPKEFGVRLEHDVYVNPDGKSVRVTQGLQTEIVTLGGF
jgi:Xaa-Pro aminopeptidase